MSLERCTSVSNYGYKDVEIQKNVESSLCHFILAKFVEWSLPVDSKQDREQDIFPLKLLKHTLCN